jgi:hypothetical protein
MSEREIIVNKLIKYGHNPQLLVRTQLFKLEEMIKKHELEEQEQTLIENDMKDSVSNKSIRKLTQVKVEPQYANQTYDDNCTVIDMSSKANANNYVDEMYNKFKESILNRNKLMHAIKTNTKMLQDFSHKLDEDVIFTITQDINKCQSLLTLVLNEMEQKRSDLCRIKLEKKSFYEKYKNNLVDLSGNLYKFFDTKLENINKYLEEINLMDEDYKQF